MKFNVDKCVIMNIGNLKIKSKHEYKIMNNQILETVKHHPYLGVESRLAIDRSICILTRPVVITGFNWSLLVDWWSIGRLKKNMVNEDT